MKCAPLNFAPGLSLLLFASAFLSFSYFSSIKFLRNFFFRFYLAIREEASQRLTDGSGNRPYYRYLELVGK